MFPEELDQIQRGLAEMIETVTAYRVDTVGQGDLVATLYMTWEDEIEPLLRDVRVDNEMRHSEFVRINREREERD